MTDLVNQDSSYSKTRLLTAICLIMMIEHKHLSLSEIIHATGMAFSEIRVAMQNIVNLRLISVIPSYNGIPEFKLINEEAAQEYLLVLGVNSSAE